MQDEKLAIIPLLNSLSGKKELHNLLHNLLVQSFYVEWRNIFPVKKNGDMDDQVL